MTTKGCCRENYSEPSFVLIVGRLTGFNISPREAFHGKQMNNVFAFVFSLFVVHVFLFPIPTARTPAIMQILGAAQIKTV